MDSKINLQHFLLLDIQLAQAIYQWQNFQIRIGGRGFIIKCIQVSTSRKPSKINKILFFVFVMKNYN